MHSECAGIRLGRLVALCLFFTTLIGPLHPQPALAATVNLSQSGSVTLANTTSSVTVTAPAFTAVTPANAFLVFNISVNTENPRDGLVAGQIIGGGATLEFRRDTTGTVGDVTIEWYVAEFSSGVSVERGSLNIATSQNVPITCSDLTKCFPIVTYRNKGTGFNPDEWVRAEITSTTNLRLTARADSLDLDAEWQMVEFTDSAVQTGNVNFAAGDSSKTVGPITAVDTSKSWLLYSHEVTGTDPNIGRGLIRGRITDTTTLTFDRDVTGIDLDLTWYLVEFTDQTTVRRGDVNFANGELSKFIFIDPPVNPARSISGGGHWQKGGKSNYTTADNPGIA